MTRLYVLLATLLLCLGACQANSDATVQAARDAYTSGDLNAAITLGTQAIESGARQPDLLILLGHAYAQTEDWGRALLNYRRALAVAPRDYAAQLGAALVRAQRIDVLPEDVSLSAALTSLTASWLSASELAWITLAVFALLILLSVRWILQPVNRKNLRLWLVLVAMTFAVLSVLALVRTTENIGFPQAVLTAFEADALAGDALDRAVLFRLHNAAEFHEAERRDGWGRVVLSDGREGWLPVNTYERVALP